MVLVVQSRSILQDRKRMRTNPRPHGWVNTRYELKYRDERTSSVNIFASEGALILNQNICGVPQGSGPTQRVGRAVTAKSLEVCVRLNRQEVRSATLAVAVGDVQLRFILVADRQTNGAAHTFAEAFNTAPSGGTAFLTAFPNLENRLRFRILYSRTVDLNVLAMNYDSTDDRIDAAAHSVQFKFKVALNDTLTYNGGDGTIGDATTTSYHFWMAHDSTGGNINTVTNYRLRYTDL